MIVASEIERLRGRRANGSDGPAELPQTLALGQIKVRPAAFQHRADMDARSYLHVQELVSGIQASGKLDPVTVWWDGFEWVCIDGHHRIAAYREAGWDDYSQIPTTVFDGTPDEAVREALRGNSKAKLPMTQEERLDAALTLVRVGGHTAAQIAEAASVSERTVKNMRATYRKVIDEMGVKPAAADRMSWADLRWAARGGARSGEEWDGNAAARELADRFTRTFGRTFLTENPEVLAEALRIYDRRMPEALAQFIERDALLAEDDEDEAARGVDF